MMGERRGRARGLAVALVALAAGCGGADASIELAKLKAAMPDPDAARVEVAVVAPSQVALTLELPGEVAGVRDALLSTPLGGLVERLHVAEGEQVSAGQVLIRIDGEVYAAQHDQAVAQLAQAEAELHRLERLGDLATDSELMSTRTQVKVAEANLRAAKANLDRAVLRAPFAGVVGQVGVEVGEMASPGAPLLRLVQLDPIEISLSVSDRDVVSLRPGLAARVRTQAQTGIRTGEVAHVSPVADLSTRSFLVEVQLPNPGHELLPGMIATVEVDRPLGAEAIVVPQDWVVTQLDGYGVFVEQDGVASWRAVELGDVLRGEVVVRSGLQAGDRVVMVGQHGLVDGDKVLVGRAGRCCTDGRAVFDGTTAAAR